MWAGVRQKLSENVCCQQGACQFLTEIEVQEF